MANEKRLIDLDANLKRLEKESWWLDEVKSCIRMFLAKAKLVDAVEVVRCKDCKHIETIENSTPYCTWHNSGCGYNDFCSYGERSE